MSIDMLESFLSNVPIQTRFEIFKYLIKEKKSCLWMTGWLYVIPTYEQKLIWSHMESYVRNYYVHRTEVRYARNLCPGESQYQSRPDLKFSNI